MRRLPAFTFAIALLLTSMAAAVAAPQLWEQLIPRKAVSADPNQDYTLTEQNGPWLVMATSFTGEEGKAQAEELVLELRRKYNLPAYYYGMEFDMGDMNPGVESMSTGLRSSGVTTAKRSSNTPSSWANFQPSTTPRRRSY